MVTTRNAKMWVVLLTVLVSMLALGGIIWAETLESAALPPEIEQALGDLSSRDRATREAAVSRLSERGDTSLLPRLEKMREDAGRRLRVAIKPVYDLLKNKANLASTDPDTRRAAATDLGNLGQPVAVPWLQDAIKNESHTWVRYSIEEAIYHIGLNSNNTTAKVEAARRLGELNSLNALPALQDLLRESAEDFGDGEQLSEDDQAARRLIAKATTEAIDRIELWASWANGIETVFRGISLSSILLLMALGLSIVFGLMGVINMAHGELMMLGAYATFITQELFKAYVPADLFDYYFLVSLPVSFLAAGVFGLLLEATLIRFLYGRPLETLLATWGVSLVLIQAARVTFGDLTSVTAPKWLNGGVQVMVGVYLPYNRLFIIALSALCVGGISFLLFWSGVGLRVRAVMQNRDMSACLGIATRKVDAYTFAFGSGLAGLAGCALTLIGNVEPELGRNYIVDSFMVVVTGGVGKLAGTVVAAFGIGSLNKLLEPTFGAVYGKVLILILVILFLQWRPSGLFAIRGRYVES